MTGRGGLRRGQNASMVDRGHEEVVRRSFEQQAPLFAGADSIFAQRPSGTLSWIEPLSNDMIVLDVACGAGHAAEPVARRVRQVVGVDLTPALLHIGRERLRDAKIENVLFQEANAELLPFVDESFDIVFCRSSLHHFADAQRAVEEMFRVCRIGGRVVIVDLIAPLAYARDQFDHIHRLLDPSHVRTFLGDELVELVPGGVDVLTYADTTTSRFPIDVAFGDQSDSAAVLDLLHAKADGTADATGFGPVVEDGKVVVSFISCVIHAERD
jgi:ubiquinone/menaquinone biosynthesis C-methylase UbiE